MPLDRSSARAMPAPLLLEPRLRSDGVQPRGRARIGTVLLALVLLALIGAGPAVYLGLTDIGVYNSPDETSRYLTARAFAETGRLALSDAISALDLTGTAGPRGFVQTGDEITTIYPLGQPFLVGLAYRTFGDATVVLLAIVPACLFASLGGILLQLRPRLPAVALMILPLALPIWFWASFVHLDVGLAWTFAAAGLLCWLRAIATGRILWVAPASAGFALAALTRHQEAPFLLLVALALIAAMAWRHPGGWRLAGTVSLYGLVQIALFLLPMADLNGATYGGALTFGNTLFYRELFPERLPEDRGAVMDALGFLKLAFFPQPISAETMLRGLWFQIFLISPPLVILGLYGTWTARRRLLGALGPVGLAGLGLALVYVFVSRSDPGVVGAGASAPDLSSSLTRYYWPVYVALALGAGVAVAAMGQTLSRALVAGLMVLGGYTIWLAPQDSLTAWQRLVIEQRDRFVPLVEAATEPDAVIYTGNIDKWIVGSRRVISFWQEGGATYQARSMMDPARVATDAATIRAAGFPVYFLFRPANGENVTALEVPLATQGLGVEWVDRFARGLDLWRVVPLPVGGTVQRLSPDAVAIAWSGIAAGEAVAVERRTGFAGGWRAVTPLTRDGQGMTVADPVGPRPSFYRIAPGEDAAVELPVLGPAAPLRLEAADDGWHTATLIAGGPAEALWITADGSSANLIANPSFETGLDLWRGADPGPTGLVAPSVSRAAAGDASMLMSLAPSPEGTRIARTLHLDTAGLTSAQLSLRAQVMVAAARDVRIELRLIAKSADGQDVLFAGRRAPDTAEPGFVPVLIEGLRLPADAVSVEVQVTVIATADRGTALVFWDGMELRPHADLPPAYLDGDTPGAAWAGLPHASQARRPATITAIRIGLSPRSGPAIDALLEVEARRGDRIEIADGVVTLRTAEGAIRARESFPALAAGDGLTLSLRSEQPTGLARVETGARAQ